MEILLSDFHIAPFREEKFLTQKKSFGEWLIQFFVDILKEKEARTFAAMMRIIRERNISLGIVNGDLMESSATERGMDTERDLKAATIVKRWLERLLGVSLILNMGNHECGYKNQPLVTDPKAGISKRSLKNFLCLTERDDLYFSFFLDGYKVIFIPYLFTEIQACDFDIDEEKAKFLQKMREDLEQNENIIIFAHDPESLGDPGLCNLLRTHREKIKLFFCGHYHSTVTLNVIKVFIMIFNSRMLLPYRWMVKIMLWYAFSGNANIVKLIEQYFRKRKNIPNLVREFGVKIIPAPTGMFGIGGGFLTLNLETLEVKKN